MLKGKVVDLFCGAGGLSLGFKMAGFKPVFAADNDADACATYAQNLGSHVHQIDLGSMASKSIASQINREYGNIDVVAGGPPCQGFSVQRRGNPKDDRNRFVVKFAEICAHLKPKAVVIENVPTLLGSRGKLEYSKTCEILGKSGYNVYSQIVQAADFGVPQMRRRAFIVGVRSGLPFSFPDPLLVENEYISVRKALAGLPELPSNFMPHPNIANHQRRRISDKNLERISYVPEGGGRLDIPPELQLACHRSSNGHRHLDVYGRLWWDRPAPTITAMFDNFTRGRFAHPVENRNITNREGARFQSFPDDFVFLGAQKTVARQIGNAVPPLLARTIAESLPF